MLNRSPKIWLPILLLPILPLVLAWPLGCSNSSGSSDGGTTGKGGASAAGTTGAAAGNAGTTGAAGTAGSTAGTSGAAGHAGTSGGGTAGTTGTSVASVLQHHNDLARDGLYVDAALTKTAAAGMDIDASFAGAMVTGNVYAQPLYLAGVNGQPDQVIVATERDNVYAFNAATGAQLWTKSVGTSVSSGLPCGNISPLGVTGTPVIDGPNRIVYLDAMTTDATVTAKHMVHALNADTGAELTGPGWPVDVNATASSGGTAFNSLVQNQRAALGLVGGKVFIPYSGHVGDCQGYHGWVVGVTTAATPAVSAWATRAIAGGIWGASGIASDGTSIFVATGNSKSSAAAGPNSSSGDNGGSWGDGETVYKFPLSLTAPAMATTTDYFVPSNWVNLDDTDADIGGTAPVLVNVPGATPSSLVVALGKDDNAYLLNRSNLGGMDATPLAKMKVATGAIINAFVAYTTATATYVVFKGAGSGCPSGQSGGLTAIKIAAASPPTMSIAWCGGPATSYSPAVSQTDGSGSNTIVWAVGSDNKLHGVDGDTGASVFAGEATAMSAVQSIQTPIIANGRIFVASNSQVYAFKP
jgi:outer membrane protein assembly factor BamB